MLILIPSFPLSQRIPAGEELVYDYNWVARALTGRHMRCNCGARKCTGDMFNIIDGDAGAEE